MLTSAEWLALIASSIGVAGTLAGAAISQAFANKRENRREVQLNQNQTELWEREDWLRFLDDKKIAYATLIAKMHLWLTQMQCQLHGDYGGQAYPPDGFGKFESEITMIRAQLELIAPPKVWTAAEVLWASGATTALTLSLPDMYSEKKRDQNISSFAGNLTKCIAAMRDDLAEGRQRLTVSRKSPTGIPFEPDNGGPPPPKQ